MSRKQIVTLFFSISLLQGLIFFFFGATVGLNPDRTALEYKKQLKQKKPYLLQNQLISISKTTSLLLSSFDYRSLKGLRGKVLTYESSAKKRLRTVTHAQSAKLNIKENSILLKNNRELSLKAGTFKQEKRLLLPGKNLSILLKKKYSDISLKKLWGNAYKKIGNKEPSQSMDKAFSIQLTQHLLLSLSLAGAATIVASTFITFISFSWSLAAALLAGMTYYFLYSFCINYLLIPNVFEY